MLTVDADSSPPPTVNLLLHDTYVLQHAEHYGPILYRSA